MSDPTITDKAVTAAADALKRLYGYESDWHPEARTALEAALPHLADQPATPDDRPVCPCVTDDTYVHPGERSADQPATTGALADAIDQDERDQADAVDPEVHRPSADYLAGYRAATARAAEIARQSADREGETAALRDRLVRDRDAALTLAADQRQQHRAEIAKLRNALHSVWGLVEEPARKDYPMSSEDAHTAVTAIETALRGEA